MPDGISVIVRGEAVTFAPETPLEDIRLFFGIANGVLRGIDDGLVYTRTAGLPTGSYDLFCPPIGESEQRSSPSIIPHLNLGGSPLTSRPRAKSSVGDETGGDVTIRLTSSHRRNLRAKSSARGASPEALLVRFPTQSSENGEPVEQYLISRAADLLPKPSTLEERHRMNNATFGFIPWKSSVQRHSVKITDNAQHPSSHWRSSFLNSVFHFILVGWWLALLYIVLGLLQMVLFVNRRHGLACLHLVPFVAFPERKYLFRASSGPLQRVVDVDGDFPGAGASNERTPLSGRDQKLSDDTNDGSCGWCRFWCCFTHSFTRTSDFSGFTVPAPTFSDMLFLFAVAPFLALAHYVAAVLMWLPVITLPMAKHHFSMTKLVFRDILTIRTGHGYPSERDILVWVSSMTNRQYKKYAVDGMNVVIFNMFLMTVPAAVLCGMFVDVDKGAIPICTLCLTAVVPISMYIGQAVSTISAQSTFAVGAILNVTFGSIIDLILYCLQIQKGLTDMLTATVTGALLTSLLLLPGVSMIAGGLVYKEQNFNQAAASISANMIILCVSGITLPTIYYHLHGYVSVDCSDCLSSADLDGIISNITCAACRMDEVSPDTDEFFRVNAKYVMYCCAAVLPLIYLVGLFFTLRTHSHIYEEDPGAHNPPPHVQQQAAAANGNAVVCQAECETSILPHTEGHGGGHGSLHGEAKWGKFQCVATMLVCTMAFAFIAHTLVDRVEIAIRALGISEHFAGLIIFAIVPAIGEFINAVQFAVKGNMSLALEIGNVGAIQVCLVQMPVMVLYSAFSHLKSSFVLIFPMLNLYAIYFASIMNTYLSIDGSSNYFEGCTLLAIYGLLAVCFWFAGLPFHHKPLDSNVSVHRLVSLR